MANKNIQMKHSNNGTWDNLYPVTLTTNVINDKGKSIENVVNDLKQYTENELNNKLDKDIFENHENDVLNNLNKKEDKINLKKIPLNGEIKQGVQLKVNDIMQNFVYDKTKHVFYVAYPDQRKEFQTDTLIIEKLDYSGNSLGRMFLSGFGHGDGMTINPINNKIILNLERDGIYKSAYIDFVINKTITSYNELTVIPSLNDVNWKLNINHDGTLFVLINPSESINKIRIYKENILSKSVLPTPFRIIDLNNTQRPYQGIAIDNDNVYISTGVDRNASNFTNFPQRLFVYSINTGQLLKTFDMQSIASHQSSNGYGELEGMQMNVDNEGNHTLLIGYSRGQFRQRVNELYELSSVNSKGIGNKELNLKEGISQKYINDSTYILSDLVESGTYYVGLASDKPIDTGGIFKVSVSWDGVNISQWFESSNGKVFHRWVYSTATSKNVQAWERILFESDFDRSNFINVTYQNGVSTGGFFGEGLRTRKEVNPKVERVFIEGAFLINSSIKPITNDWTHIATVNNDHKPFYKVVLIGSSTSATVNNILGYIDVDGKIYIRGNAGSGGYYSFGSQSYPINQK